MSALIRIARDLQAGGPVTAQIAGKVLVERHTIVNASKEIGELLLAVLERLPAEVHTVELDEIECAEDGGVIAEAVPKGVEDRETALVDDDGLTVH